MDFLQVAPEVALALQQGRAVVALESTIVSHGMPYPQNLQTALEVEATVRACGAVPATIAILGGRPHIGAAQGAGSRAHAGGAQVSQRVSCPLLD